MPSDIRKNCLKFRACDYTGPDAALDPSWCQYGCNDACDDCGYFKRMLMASGMPSNPNEPAEARTIDMIEDALAKLRGDILDHIDATLSDLRSELGED